MEEVKQKKWTYLFGATTTVVVLAGVVVGLVFLFKSPSISEVDVAESNIVR